MNQQRVSHDQHGPKRLNRAGAAVVHPTIRLDRIDDELHDALHVVALLLLIRIVFPTLTLPTATEQATTTAAAAALTATLAGLLERLGRVKPGRVRETRRIDQ